MSLLKLPEIKAFDPISSLAFEVDADAAAKWHPGVRAATEGTDDNIVSIYDVIGADPWNGEGVTAKRIAASLRKIGNREITVNMNSPGGDYFEGLAIYNLFREHPHKITVKIMGLAASAASVIAMAGDEVQISDIGFMMVHNAHGIVIGNRHDMRDAAEMMEPFDDMMAGLYASKAGVEKKHAAKWMDKETWFAGNQAVEAGLATGLLPSAEVANTTNSETQALAALRRVDAVLARQGMPRGERKTLLSELKRGMPGAAADTMPGAGHVSAADFQRLISTLRS